MTEFQVQLTTTKLSNCVISSLFLKHLRRTSKKSQRYDFMAMSCYIIAKIYDATTLSVMI